MRTKGFIVFLLICTIYGTTDVSGQQTKSSKRGVAYNIPYTDDLTTLTKGLSWFYNWGITPTSAISSSYNQYLDYCPMAWNGVNASVLRTFKSAHPECAYILAFNEPNLTNQANMTPTQAAAKWPDLKAIATELNLKIISPAMNYGTLPGYSDPITWLDEFFTKVPLSDIDGIAIHCYMSNPTSVASYVSLFKKYGKPIWLTEFCAWDGLTAATFTPDQQKDYMVEAVTLLENDTNVFRYAWFQGRNSSGETAFPYYALLTAQKGVLTELGDIYINMSSFDKNYYFSSQDTIQAEKFSNSHSASLRRMDATSGNLYLNGFYFKDWATYQVDLPESKTYTITFKIACIDGTTLQILDSLGNLLSSQDIPNTGGLTTWGFRNITVALPAGKQTIQLKSMGEGCNIDWFTFSAVNTAVQNVASSRVFSLYPNPMTDVLNIDTQENTQDIKIFNTLGKLVYHGINEKQINTADFSKGVYVVQLTFTDGTKLSGKILK